MCGEAGQERTGDWGWLLMPGWMLLQLLLQWMLLLCWGGRLGPAGSEAGWLGEGGLQ